MGNTQNNAWGGQEPTAEILTNHWQEFLQTPCAQTNVPNRFDKLQTVIQSQQEPEDEPCDEQGNTQDGRSYPNFILYFTTLNKHQIQHMTGTKYEVVDINSFREMQGLAYNIVKSHFYDVSSEKEPLCLIIIGVAGTGKSYLINAIRNLLQDKCSVTATTGKASYNIRGITVHSLLKLPIGSRGEKDLTGQSLCRFQESLNRVHYILIDEYSMFGQVNFGWIDQRCKQAT